MCIMIIEPRRETFHSSGWVDYQVWVEEERFFHLKTEREGRRKETDS